MRKATETLYYGGTEALSGDGGGVVRSVLFLVPSGAAKVSEEACAALSLPSQRVVVEAPTGLSRPVAASCLAALSSLPTPTLLVCASGNRASAVAAMAQAGVCGWGGQATLEWALEQRLPFLNIQGLRNWVVSRVDPAPLPTPLEGPSLVFRQLFDAASSTFTYLLGCPASGEAVLIDPVLGKLERDLGLLNELGLHLTTALNTHVHADHVSATSALKAKVPGCKSALAGASGGAADVCLEDGDRVSFGGRHLTVIPTPGHTSGCVSFLLDGGACVFTGDALLVRGCGRTDFQGGSASTLFTSIHTRIFTLPHATTVFPGHDYNGLTRSTVGEEVRLNPRLGAGRTREDFEGIMAALQLARPVLMDVAVPANLWDGDAERAAAVAAGVMEAGRGLPTQCARCNKAVEEGKREVGGGGEGGGATGGAAAIAP